jgi:hypothetical protein
MQHSNLEIINKLDAAGDLKPLIKAGLFPVKVLLHRDIFYYVDARKKAGIRPRDFIHEVEVMFKVKRATVYNVIKSFS